MSSEKILMLEKIPEWKDAEVQLEDQKKMVEYGRSLGFTDEELNMIYDHRALLALYKSWKFDQLMNGDKVQAAKSKIGSVKSGNRETVRHTRSRKQKAQRAKLKETGKVEDAAALFSQMLAE
jgi:VIT1/CCC1 family predicted Fe2+/Mn2+ transporter